MVFLSFLLFLLIFSDSIFYMENLINESVKAFSFGDRFSDKYFLGGATFKKSFIDFVDPLCVSTCHKAFTELLEGLPMIESDRSMCTVVLDRALLVNPNWFILPTSTGGKYHGGVTGVQNTCGGIYQHVKALIDMCDAVLGR